MQRINKQTSKLRAEKSNQTSLRAIYNSSSTENAFFSIRQPLVQRRDYKSKIAEYNCVRRNYRHNRCLLI